jgi:hypothetical protein
MAGTPYARVAAPHYADGIGAIAAGPNARYVSNRVFNDLGQNLFSENNISQWGWAWGQFLDHDLDLRDSTPGTSAWIAFDHKDPLEQFTNDLGAIAMTRTPAAPGTGTSVTAPRQQVNTISSFIDASQVYGTTNARLDWLRAGPLDGDPTNNDAHLLLPGGYLPAASARGDAAHAPAMELDGRLAGDPADARVAGDVRANENIALTAIQTLFAREHNRIVDALPASMRPEDKFQIARRVVYAEIQWITYNQFLPALGVKLPAYKGYNPNVNPAVTNEFATVGFRGHSMVHGEFDIDFAAGAYSPVQLAGFTAQGVIVDDGPSAHRLIVPLTVAFGNPDLLQQIGIGPVLRSLAVERDYKNDEQIDNTMRSVLFEVPKPGVTDPGACQTPVVDPQCFSDVSDLTAIDVQRGRDHGMPGYNDLRKAYGLAPEKNFKSITGESTQNFPRDPLIDSRKQINDPNILDFVQLKDAGGTTIPLGSPAAQTDAVTGIRRSTLAARLHAIYGTVNKMDAFVGMMAAKHVPGTEFGELELAMWTRQFAALRDGDRFFYANDPSLDAIASQYHVGFRLKLSDIVNLNTNAGVGSNVFSAGDAS